MEILLTGLNHATAPIEVRERAAVAPGGLPAALRELTRRPSIREAYVLSTCNRTEVLIAADDRESGLGELARFFAARTGLDSRALEPSLYRHAGPDAVGHLFTVASGLDSMVLGETEILGQTKSAYSAAVKAKATGKVLNRLLHTAFRVAKLNHATSGISFGRTSVAEIESKLAALGLSLREE